MKMVILTIAMATLTIACGEQPATELAAVSTKDAKASDGADGKDGQGCVAEEETEDGIVLVCGKKRTLIPRGPEGKRGAEGKDGKDGHDGKDGLDGKDGENGHQGEKGGQGEQGDAGIAGAAGADGSDGADGHDGATGAVGATGAAGTQGTQGATGAQGPAGGFGLGVFAATSSQRIGDYAGFDGSYILALVPKTVTRPEMRLAVNGSGLADLVYLYFPSAGCTGAPRAALSGLAWANVSRRASNGQTWATTGQIVAGAYSWASVLTTGGTCSDIASSSTSTWVTAEEVAAPFAYPFTGGTVVRADP